MYCNYVVLGFGMRGIEGIRCIHEILGRSISRCGPLAEAGNEAPGFVVTVPDDEADSLVLGSYSSIDMATAQDAPLYLLMLVDDSDPAAVKAATEMGHRAHEVGVYLSMAVFASSIAHSADDGFVLTPELRKLRHAVDSLVLVKPSSQDPIDEVPGTRVALALISAILPRVINIICTDIGDIKQVLHGYVVANAARTRHTDLSHNAAGKEISSQIDVTTTGFVYPQGLFCSYSASPQAANPDDFSMVGTFVRDAMGAAYPNTDYDLVAACLLDKSLNDFVEVVTCISFPDIA